MRSFLNEEPNPSDPLDIRINQIISDVKTIKESVVLKKNFEKEVLGIIEKVLRESHSTPTSNELLHKILAGVKEKSFRNDDELEHDFFSIMMLNKIISPAWGIGLFAFITQIVLGSFVILEQIKTTSFGTLLSVPIRSSTNHSLAQALVIILSVMTQTDLLLGFRTILSFPYKDKDRWRKIAKTTRENLSVCLWLQCIFLPNFLKILQGTLILVATFFIIIQSDGTVNLLKDYSALFVISSIDDLFFFMAETGYFGSHLSKKAHERRDVNVDKYDKNIRHWLVLLLTVTTSIMMGSFLYVSTGQKNGRYVKQMHPLCPVEDINPAGNFKGERNTFLEEIGDGTCQYIKGVSPNTIECGWEGGDCLILNDRYPDCVVVDPSLLGNGNCDGELYMSSACGYDDGDCFEHRTKIDKYPNCVVIDVDRWGDGNCDFGDFNTVQCGFDDGDCKNTKNELILNFPNCPSLNSSSIGDGNCNSLESFSLECGFDGVDCGDCNVDNLALVESGFCDVPPMELINVTSENKNFNWGQAVLVENRFVYALPVLQEQVLKIDPEINSTSLSEDRPSGSWMAAVASDDGSIYGISFGTTGSILKFNPKDDNTTLIAERHPLLSKMNAFLGGVLAGNGKIYLIPSNHNKVVIFDPCKPDDPLTEIGEDLGNGNIKYSGGVLGWDGNIYGIPGNAKRVLKITVNKNTTSLIGEEYSGTWKWAFGILARDGNIYSCPHSSNRVLQINVQSQTTNLTGPDLGNDVEKWVQFVEGSDGFFYGIPYRANSLLRFDPVVNKTAALIPLDDKLYENNLMKWFGGVRAGNGVIYTSPFRETQILAIST